MTASQLEKITASIGLIGLGHIGMALASRLLEQGYQLRGFRRSDMNDFSKLGGIAENSINALTNTSDVIILALPDAETSLSVVQEINASEDDSRKTIIDFTSMSPANAKACAKLASVADHIYIESPVSGTAVMVKHYQATILAGATAEDFSSVEPILSVLAANVIHTGNYGSASAIKSAALMMIATNTLAVAEALAYTESYGVDAQIAINALAHGPAGSGALSYRGPLMVNKAYEATIGELQGFMHIIDAILSSATTPTKMLEQVVTYLTTAVNAGDGNKDVAAVYEQLRPTT
jgi:3-hydroxyisobutyrate dehydrogenase-like beta-hydroxyacid dehydrogenase